MVINPPLILVSALFLLALCSILYVASWAIASLVLRFGRGRITNRGAKRILMTALLLPPLLALVPTIGGATFKHSHVHESSEHHSMLCQQMFTQVFDISGHGSASAGLFVNGLAWLMTVFGIGLLIRLIIATFRLEQGLAPYLLEPSPKLAAALEALHQNMPKLRRNQFYECAIPAAYSSVFGLLQVRCVLSSEFVQNASEAELLAVVAHEAAHLQAKDVWVTLLIGALNCLFFPLRPVRLLARRWREAAELACDDAAVAVTRNPLAMASAILRVSGITVKSSHITRGLPATTLAFADEAACPPSKRVERLIAQAEHASMPPVMEAPLQSVGAWIVTLLLASFGVSILTSSAAICFAHCSLEMVARFLP